MNYFETASNSAQKSSENSELDKKNCTRTENKLNYFETSPKNIISVAPAYIIVHDDMLNNNLSCESCGEKK